MKNLGVEEMIKQWIIENIPDFNTTIHTEEDMKIKVLLPYLKSCFRYGQEDDELLQLYQYDFLSLFYL